MNERILIKYDKNRNISEYNTDENELGNKYFESLGNMVFFYANDELNYFLQNIEEQVPYYFKGEEKEYLIESIKESHYQDWIADLMTGQEFLDSVECGGIIDYDGNLSEIYIDGYKSNLGLIHKGFCQGQFLVDCKAFKNICENHHVLVNWANK